MLNSYEILTKLKSLSEDEGLSREQRATLLMVIEEIENTKMDDHTISNEIVLGLVHLVLEMLKDNRLVDFLSNL